MTKTVVWSDETEDSSVLSVMNTASVSWTAETMSDVHEWEEFHSPAWLAEKNGYFRSVIYDLGLNGMDDRGMPSASAHWCSTGNDLTSHYHRNRNVNLQTNFRARVPLSAGGRAKTVTIVDSKGRITRKDFFA